MSVSYTNKPISVVVKATPEAGVVVIVVRSAVVTLLINKPLSTSAKSKEAFAFNVVVPTPICAPTYKLSLIFALPSTSNF